MNGQSLIGMTEGAAKKALKKQRTEFRIVSIDGKPFIVTMDYKPDRLNLTIEKGIVTKATNG